jgi:hypothetical protein
LKNEHADGTDINRIHSSLTNRIKKKKKAEFKSNNLISLLLYHLVGNKVLINSPFQLQLYTTLEIKNFLTENIGEDKLELMTSRTELERTCNGK